MCGKLLENQREVERYTALAKSVDAAAMRLARGRPALDVALGEVFFRLSRGKLLLDLNATKTTDFANELGIPPREYFDLLKLGRALQERPLLKQAMLAGEVTTVKAMVVLDLAVGEDESIWTARAMEETVTGLRKLAKEKGGTGGEGRRYGYETLRLAMTPAQQDRLDYALFLARDFLGFDASRWRLWEELRREWMEFRQRSDVDIRVIDEKEKKKLQATREEFLGPAFGRRFAGLRPSQKAEGLSWASVLWGENPPPVPQRRRDLPPTLACPRSWRRWRATPLCRHRTIGSFSQPRGRPLLERSETGESAPRRREHVGVAASERSERSRVGDHGPLEEMAP